MLHILFMTFSFLLSLGFATQTYAGNIACPPLLSETPVVSSPNNSWLVVAARGDRQLKHVGVYLNDPFKQGQLVPDSTKKTSTAETVTWNLTHSKDEQVWIGCSYTGTTAMLFQQLAETASNCVASYDLLRSGKRLRLRSMDCK